MSTRKCLVSPLSNFRCLLYLVLSENIYKHGFQKLVKQKWICLLGYGYDYKMDLFNILNGSRTLIPRKVKRKYLKDLHSNSPL